MTAAIRDGRFIFLKSRSPVPQSAQRNKSGSRRLAHTHWPVFEGCRVYQPSGVLQLPYRTGNCGAHRALDIPHAHARSFLELKAQEAAERQLKSLGIMAASLAHEIRNPLGAIKGLTQLAQEDLAPDNAAQRTLGHSCIRSRAPRAPGGRPA